MLTDEEHEQYSQLDDALEAARCVQRRAWNVDAEMQDLDASIADVLETASTVFSSAAWNGAMYDLAMTSELLRRQYAEHMSFVCLHLAQIRSDMEDRMAELERKYEQEEE